LKLGQLLENPKALDTMNSNNSKDITMDNQQLSLLRKLKKSSETNSNEVTYLDAPSSLDLSKDEDIVRTSGKPEEIGRNSNPLSSKN